MIQKPVAQAAGFFVFDNIRHVGKWLSLNKNKRDEKYNFGYEPAVNGAFGFVYREKRNYSH
jgi:hypothetical protein